MNFELGDKVVYKPHFFGWRCSHPLTDGMTGTFLGYSDEHADIAGVEFDEKILGHNCGGGLCEELKMEYYQRISYEDYLHATRLDDSRLAWVDWKITICGMDVVSAAKASYDPEWGWEPIASNYQTQDSYWI